MQWKSQMSWYRLSSVSKNTLHILPSQSIYCSFSAWNRASSYMGKDQMDRFVAWILRMSWENRANSWSPRVREKIDGGGEVEGGWHKTNFKAQYKILAKSRKKITKRKTKQQLLLVRLQPKGNFSILFFLFVFLLFFFPMVKVY